MSLTGSTFPILLGGLGALLLVTLVLGFPRVGKPWLAMLLRGINAILLNAVVLLLAFALLNDEYAFYASWDDLFGTPTVAESAHGGADAQAAAEVATTGGALTGVKAAISLPPLQASRVQSFIITGATSGFTGQILVYVPPHYDPAAATRYPVIEVLHGFPASPATALVNLRVGDYVDTAVSKHKLAQPILVIPQIDNPNSVDDECINIPGGPQVETWLGVDVPRWTAQHFRTRTDRGSWATLGYSYGGWCSAVLGMRHSSTFVASIILLGYFRPDFSKDYDPIPARSPYLRQYDLVQVAAHRPPPVALWILTSKQDALSYPSTSALLSSARPPLSVTADVLQVGGHRREVITPAIPRSLAWLGRDLPGFRA
ncbi:alpha/beta hydrolase-fold protein [Nakamurella sp. A5-74]|uniref:Alpha/beta hydrolase-fold protein n=1 Tax=Nakamurella sp. A5-74 TaxID=3158264 RepID=A0AAU8DIX1_9ACTN